ncbi:hypothetical protein [Streptomyces sp. NBC_01216]|uniref:hypothetical protein n=1 Tax=Streptomyces sp. NBC_01216 TaxID=2903778 RepID=UPI003FA3D140
MSSGRPGLPDLLRRDAVERRYAGLTGDTPRDMDVPTPCAALRHAIVALGVAYRQVYFGEARLPEDPDDLILHRATLTAMVRRSRRW